MIIPTLIGRELRTTARQPHAYYLRTATAAALVLAFAVAFLQGPQEAGGRHVFARLHAALLWAIWLLVPILTADCISRERREQTLPILFLTLLKPWHVIIAKGLSQSLRAMTHWAAVFPVLTVPFIVGGVGWTEALLSGLLGISSICLATAAGLSASSQAKVHTRALILALSINLALFCGLAFTLGFAVAGYGAPGQSAPAWPSRNDPGPVFRLGLDLVLDRHACWQDILGASARTSPNIGPRASATVPKPVPLLDIFTIASVACFVALIVAIKASAWNVARDRREEAPPLGLARIANKLRRPVYFQALFERWMHWELNHNPIGWLEERTWSARLVTWAWFAVLICVYSSLLANFQLYERSFHTIQTGLACLLALSIALSSSLSFHRERETGLLELLLVCPLRERQIINGRLRGLWLQFMPAIGLLLGLWTYFATFLAESPTELGCVLFYAATFLTLPIVGLYESLARSSSIAAFISTLFLSLAVPMILVHIGDRFGFVLLRFGEPNTFLQSSAPMILVAIPFQCGLASLCAWRLNSNLKHRRFVLSE